MFNYSNHVVKNDMERIKCSISDYFCQMKDKSVLITGATGMLATYCIYFLLYLNDVHNTNIKVVGLVRNKKKAELRFDDILKRDDFSILVQDIVIPFNEQEPYDYIIHMAGSASAWAILEDPVGIIRANVDGTINVMEQARKNPNCRVLFASTREVYGQMPSNIKEISEDMIGVTDQMNTRSCYPESKRMAENIIATYNNRYNVDAVITRIAHSYGPGMALNNDGRVMADLLNDAVSTRDIVLKSTGLMKRAFCYITDAVSAIFIALLKGKSGEAYNVANEREDISIRDLAQLICNVVDNTISVTYKEATEEEKKGYLQIDRVCLSTTKLENLGWCPQVSLEDGIKQTLSVFKQ